MIELVPIESVHASEYNPRRNDEKRLALTELSLRKLGFLLPIYADRSGEILSGHQRHLVASRMGFTQIPVEYVSGKDLGERKAVNVLFNRATNDLQKQDTCDIIRRRLYEMDVESMVDGLPDIDPQSPDAFPCVNALARRDTVQLAKSLERRIGTAMPIVIGASENVINGIGRLQVAAEAKRPVVRCVVVTKEQEAFATAMLNLLSMDFDIASYADDLRYNSFMRERNTRETDAEGNAALGDGFFKGVFPKNRGRDFCKLEGAALEAWRRHYGSSVVDFGAGKLNNTRTLRKAGIHVAAFEPYFVTVGENIHKAKSVEIAEKFLDDVEAGTPFTSVFISSVFNSVPFMAYRRFMLRQICESIVDGGALIYVEKVVAGSLDDLMVDLYYQMKRENGYTDEQIMAKRRSLENVLSPLEPEWNEALLKEVGFRRVQMFWRCLNFCGWIAVK